MRSGNLSQVPGLGRGAHETQIQILPPATTLSMDGTPPVRKRACCFSVSCTDGCLRGSPRGWVCESFRADHSAGDTGGAKARGARLWSDWACGCDG